MSLIGIEQVTYGVENLNEAKQFFKDWGLQCIAETENQIVLETLNGAQVVLRPINDPNLPAVFEAAPLSRLARWRDGSALTMAGS